MKLIKPFPGLRPLATYVEEIIAPPYDVINSQEARLFAKDKPRNFLHISKPEIDLKENIDSHSKAVYKRGAANLTAMREQGLLIQDESPCYYVYRLQSGAHCQTGLVAAATVEAYNADKIRRHELTRPDKENDRAEHAKTLNAQISPVFLTYKKDNAIDALLHRVTETTTAYDVTDAQGVRHSFWVVSDAEIIEQFSQHVNALDELYIADGHHRCASAAQVASAKSADNANYNNFPAVLFPDNEVQILGYHRLIKDLNGFEKKTFLELLSADFELTPSDIPIQPEKPTEFGMYLDKQWYRLEFKGITNMNANTVTTLDVSILHRNIIEPLLAISNPRTDERIDFVGGKDSLQKIEDRINSGDMTVAFSLFPTSTEQLMQVADSDQVMPPKSTWFEPKLADGLIALLYES